MPKSTTTDNVANTPFVEVISTEVVSIDGVECVRATYTDNSAQDFPL